MPLDNANLILVLREELNRQAEENRHPCGLYVYADNYAKEPTTIGVDGILNLDQLADMLLKAFWTN